MLTWVADERVHRDGCFEDNEEPVTGGNAADWVCWLKSDGNAHLCVRFSREGIDRTAAEEIVADVLRGLNKQ